MRAIRDAGLAMLAACTVAACAVKPHTTPSARAPELPFDPMTIAATPGGAFKGKGPYPIELAVRARRSLTATDGVSLRVVAGGTVVAAVPVIVDVPKAWTDGAEGKSFTAQVLVPTGDYEVELVHGTTPILGHAFKLAAVPVWGGGRQVHFFAHQNTRIDLDADSLRLARWVVEDEPTQAWIIEWWQGKKRILVTKGRTAAWPAFHLETVVDSATRKDLAIRPTIWTYGAERYAIPKDLILIGGMWEARIYREGAPPVAVQFELAIAPETAESRVAAIGLKLSSPLFLRPLPEGLGAGAFAAIPGKQEPTVAGAAQPLIDPIAFDRSAVRALFRSPELARKWRDFLDANAPSASALAREQAWNLTADEKRALEREAKTQRGRDPERVDAERRAKVKRLRPEIVALIRKYDGPWQPTDVPE